MLLEQRRVEKCYVLNFRVRPSIVLEKGPKISVSTLVLFSSLLFAAKQNIIPTPSNWRKSNKNGPQKLALAIIVFHANRDSMQY